MIMQSGDMEGLCECCYIYISTLISNHDHELKTDGSYTLFNISG